MKKSLCVLLIAAAVCIFFGCAGGNTAATVPTSTATTAPPPTQETTLATEPTTSPTEETVTVNKVDPYEACPLLWSANCEDFIYMRSYPGSATVLAKILPGETMELLGWSEKYAKVNYKGQEGYVLACYIRPVQDDILTDLLSVVAPTATYSYDQMRRDIDRLTAAYPDICSSDSIGKSEEGREIPVLRIGKHNAKQHVLVQGAIHAREHMTAWLIMALADFWLTNGITDYADICYHLIPMTNPDGVVISQSGKLNDTQVMIYNHDLQVGNTTESAKKYATRWKANGLGTDLNRNFPSGWEYLNEVSSPSSQLYPGSTPFSAAEAAALRDYTLRYSFNSTISYHAYGSIIYYEYGMKQPVNQQSYSLAKDVQTVTGYTPVGSDSLSGGGYKDWVMDALGIPSLTIEIGSQAAPLAERELYSVFFRNLLVLPTLAQWLNP